MPPQQCFVANDQLLSFYTRDHTETREVLKSLSVRKRQPLCFRMVDDGLGQSMFGILLGGGCEPEEFLGGQVLKCRPGAGCVSLFKDSALTLGQIGDALVYFGKP